MKNKLKRKKEKIKLSKKAHKSQVRKIKLHCLLNQKKMKENAANKPKKLCQKLICRIRIIHKMTIKLFLMNKILQTNHLVIYRTGPIHF
jgi:hypothetical protein